jgi:hypothetical protein
MVSAAFVDTNRNRFHNQARDRDACRMTKAVGFSSPWLQILAMNVPETQWVAK